MIFFPVLVSTIGVGITFKTLLDPDHGLVNTVLGYFGIQGPGWLTDPNLALFGRRVDIWKGVGLATADLHRRDRLHPAGVLRGRPGRRRRLVAGVPHIMLPLSRPAIATVIILSLIGGLRSFDIIWAMTRGGPGFTSDVIASVIYKQYQAGFYGLSTAGNVVLFIVVTAIMVPLSRFLNRKEVEL